jgi:two-component sensor histidine kinase/ActR/RegA family two-component response regulator
MKVEGSSMSSVPIESATNVLVVEDEMVLRMRAVDIVEDAGFTAIEAVNADEALSILEARSDIALLFSDIQMPGSMDGLRLAHAVHERWPSIKIILVSGHINVSDMDKPTNSLFFGKPLDVKRMIVELQAMVSDGLLKVVPKTVIPLAVEALARTRIAGASNGSTVQESLTAENDGLRLLLEQAVIDAKTLLAQAGIDAKEREAADKLQKLILEEMHHRIKNTLATVTAIASQSLRTATSIEHGQQAIEGRLIALGRAHDLLLQVSWANASLVDTVRGATKPYESQGAGRFSIDGPDIGITSGAVIALALTLNELCTNTTKFGALSVPAGRIEIAWTIDSEAQRLRLTWTENGGPVVNAPTRRSFGTRMMQALGSQLGGQVELAYKPTGFIYSLDVPLSALTLKA